MGEIFGYVTPLGACDKKSSAGKQFLLWLQLQRSPCRSISRRQPLFLNWASTRRSAQQHSWKDDVDFPGAFLMSHNLVFKPSKCARRSWTHHARVTDFVTFASFDNGNQVDVSEADLGCGQSCNRGCVRAGSMTKDVLSSEAPSLTRLMDSWQVFWRAPNSDSRLTGKEELSWLLSPETRRDDGGLLRGGHHFPDGPPVWEPRSVPADLVCSVAAMFGCGSRVPGSLLCYFEDNSMIGFLQCAKLCANIRTSQKATLPFSADLR